jgi:hypothetical protein
LAFWRRALNDHFLRDDKKTLRQPLGQWHNPEPYHHKWTWNYSLNDIIHQDQETNAITSHPFTKSVQRQFRFTKESNVIAAIPAATFPVEATQFPRHFGVPFHQIFRFPMPPDNTSPTSIQEMKNLLPLSILCLIDNVETLVTMPEATWCLEQHQAIRVASNGGAHPGRASFGWILQIGDTEIAKGKGPAYGNDPRSFRAEGYGMASALVYLRLLHKLKTY